MVARAALAIALWLAPHAAAFAPARHAAPSRRLALAPRARLDETSPEQREMLVKMGYTYDDAKRRWVRGGGGPAAAPHAEPSAAAAARPLLLRSGARALEVLLLLLLLR